MYLNSDESESSPFSVRDPQTTMPAAGKLRSTLMPCGLSWPERLSSTGGAPIGLARPVIAVMPASRPAGAFQMPREVSMRAITPATAPQGGMLSARDPPGTASVTCTRG